MPIEKVIKKDFGAKILKMLIMKYMEVTNERDNRKI